MRHLQQKDHFCMTKSNFDKKYESKDRRKRFRKDFRVKKFIYRNEKFVYCQSFSNFKTIAIMNRFLLF